MEFLTILTPMQTNGLYFFFPPSQYPLSFEHKFDLRSSILWLAFMKRLP